MNMRENSSLCGYVCFLVATFPDLSDNMLYDIFANLTSRTMNDEAQE